MNASILMAIESLCDDIASNVDPADNHKRAESVLCLAYADIFTPDENTPDENTPDENTPAYDPDCLGEMFANAIKRFKESLKPLADRAAADRATAETAKQTEAPGADTAKLPKQGEHFDYNGMEFVALGKEGGGLLAIAAKTLDKEYPFDEDDKNDWRISTLRKLLNEEYIQKFNKDDLLPYTSDLTADDGMKDYGTSEDYIFLLSCDLYRKYREYIPKYKKWVWTITPYSCLEDYAIFERTVYTDGTLYNSGAFYAYAVAPACIFNPSIFM